MSSANRRMEIIDILMTRKQTTAKELAQEFGVSIRTIGYDIQALTPHYPIYTKQGEHGGIFLREDYKPYGNTLTQMELKVLRELHEIADEFQRKILLQLLTKYGPDSLEM